MTPTIVKMWYNTQDKRLERAVQKLRELNKRRLQLKRALHPWWNSYWTLLPVVLTGGSIYLLIYTWWPFVLILLVWTDYYAGVGLWLGITCLRRNWHISRMRDDRFGAAIMWGVDAEWLALQSALQAHGIILQDFINDVRLEADLAEYLMASRHVRLRLRAEDRRPRPTHPDIVRLDEFAAQFAARIDKTLRGG